MAARDAQTSMVGKATQAGLFPSHYNLKEMQSICQEYTVRWVGEVVAGTLASVFTKRKEEIQNCAIIAIKEGNALWEG